MWGTDTSLIVSTLLDADNTKQLLLWISLFCFSILVSSRFLFIFYLSPSSTEYVASLFVLYIVTVKRWKQLTEYTLIILIAFKYKSAFDQASLLMRDKERDREVIFYCPFVNYTIIDVEKTMHAFWFVYYKRRPALTNSTVFVLAGIARLIKIKRQK